jgi:hypothetical protein
MLSLQELEEVSEQSLTMVCRGLSSVQNLTGPRNCLAGNTCRSVTYLSCSKTLFVTANIRSYIQGICGFLTYLRSLVNCLDLLHSQMYNANTQKMCDDFWTRRSSG